MNNFVNKHLNLIIIICALINLIFVLIFELPCPWKSNFDIDCAGCGATRMLKALLNLDFYQAFRFNPFIFLLLLIVIIYLIYYGICKIKKVNYYKIQDKDLIILLVGVILFTILRNITGLEFLKPTLIR